MGLCCCGRARPIHTRPRCRGGWVVQCPPRKTCLLSPPVGYDMHMGYMTTPNSNSLSSAIPLRFHGASAARHAQAAASLAKSPSIPGVVLQTTPQIRMQQGSKLAAPGAVGLAGKLYLSPTHTPPLICHCCSAGGVTLFPIYFHRARVPHMSVRTWIEYAPKRVTTSSGCSSAWDLLPRPLSTHFTCVLHAVHALIEQLSQPA